MPLVGRECGQVISRIKIRVAGPGRMHTYGKRGIRNNNHHDDEIDFSNISCKGDASQAYAAEVRGFSTVSVSSIEVLPY